MVTRKKTAGKTAQAKKTSTKKTSTKKTSTKKTLTKKTSTNKTSTKKKATTAAKKPGKATATVDRRASADRRSTSDRRKKNEPMAVERRTVERRVKVNRRRQIDPTTCERDYTNDEIEFMNALDEYKRLSGRMFPTCSEVLEVIQKLGYGKGLGAETADPSDVEPALPTVSAAPSAT